MNIFSTILNYWFIVEHDNNIKDRIPVPIEILGQKIFIVKIDKEIHAFLDRCPHFGAKLSLGLVQNSEIVCPYHGWKFKKNGACSQIPSQPSRSIPKSARLKSFKIQIYMGWVWVCIGDNPLNLPKIPDWWQNQKRKVYCEPYLFKSLATRVIENFLDVSHLPFVHTGILGDLNTTEIPTINMKIINNCLITDPMKIWQPNPDSNNNGTFVEYSYFLVQPFFGEFLKKIGNDNFRIILSTTPINENSTKVWMTICLDYNHDGTDQEIREFQHNIINQDIAVVESIDPATYDDKYENELPVKTDESIIYYRKWLKLNNINYGKKS